MSTKAVNSALKLFVAALKAFPNSRKLAQDRPRYILGAIVQNHLVRQEEALPLLAEPDEEVLVGLSLRLFPDPLLVVVVPKPVIVTAAVLQDILPAAVS